MPLKRDFENVRLNPAGVDGAVAQTPEVTFVLGGTPDKAWSGFFSHIWESESNRYPGRCAVRVVRDRLTVSAAAEDVEKIHLVSLRRAVDEANATYRRFLDREIAILDAQPAETPDNGSVDTRANVG